MDLKAALSTSAQQLWLQVVRIRLSNSEQKLARALKGHPCQLEHAIEARRKTWMQDDSPLVDESLGPAGLYDEGRTVADACRVSRKRHSALVLYSLAREFAPRTILELGTNVGISSAYLAAAGGAVTTLDVSPYRIRLAQELHRSLGLKLQYVEGLFDQTLEKALDGLPSIDMAFIDGNHQYQPTLDYFESIAKRAAPSCLFVFDDIKWSRGMKDAWRELEKSDRFRITVDLAAMGLGIMR